MTLFSNLFSGAYRCFGHNDEISLDSLLLLTVDDLKKAIRDEVQVTLENRISERLLRELSASRIKEKLKELSVNEALQISEKYSDIYPKRRNSKLTLLLDRDFVKVMKAENESSVKLLKELFDDSAVFENLYQPVIDFTASHTYRFLLKNMKEDAFTYFLRLTTCMTELAKECTYLNDDFGKCESSLAIVLYASAFVMAKLSYDYTFTCGREKQNLSLLTHSFEDTFLKENSKELSVSATPCESSARPELMVSVGLMMLKDPACKIISCLREHDCDRLISDLVKPEVTSRLFTLLSRARELISKNEQAGDCEFLEAVRPVFTGVPHTPENWFSDPKFNGETFFFPEDVLQKVKLHRSICCYVNHSKNAVESFLSSYKKLKEKLEKEQEQTESFKNGRTLLSEAAAIDFKKRKKTADGKHANDGRTLSSEDISLEKSSVAVSESQSSVPSLEDLMLGSSSALKNEASYRQCNSDGNEKSCKAKSFALSDNSDDNRQNLSSTDEKISENTCSSINGQSSLIKDLMSADAIVNRFCYQECLSDVTDVQEADSSAVKAFKIIVSKLKDHTFSSNVLKKSLEGRTAKIRSVTDVVNGFIKDGAFAIDFDLDGAVKSAATYVDFSRALLATRLSAMHNYKRNRVGVDYLTHFIEKEVVFLSKALKETV